MSTTPIAPVVTITSDDDATFPCKGHMAPQELRRSPADADYKYVLVLTHDDPATGQRCPMSGRHF